MEKNPIEHQDYLVMRHLAHRICCEPTYAKSVDRMTVDFFEGNEVFQHIYNIAKQEYRAHGYKNPIQRDWLRTELAGKLDSIGADVESRGMYDYVVQDLYVSDGEPSEKTAMNRKVSEHIRKASVTNEIKRVVAQDLTDSAIENFIKAIDRVNTETANRELPTPINVMATDELDKRAQEFRELLVSRQPVPYEAYNIATGGGLSRGEMGAIGASSGSGKAEPHSTVIPTPKGPMRFGDLEIGDYVYNRLGKPVKVLDIYEQGKKDVYRVTLKDGRSSLFNDEHLFSYFSKSGSRNENLVTKSLREIIDSGLQRADSSRKYYIPVAPALEFPEKELVIPPYTLGALIGDGSLSGERIELSIPEEKKPIIERICSETGWSYSKYSDKNLVHVFKNGDVTVKTNVLPEKTRHTAGHKSIPADYLQGSIAQRQALLQGLMDTDGSASSRKGSNTPVVRYFTGSEELAHDVLTLMRSLGYSPTMQVADRTHQEGRNLVEYIINVKGSVEALSDMFHSGTKKDVLATCKDASKRTDRSPIMSVEHLEYQEEMRCIYVDDDEHLYVTNDFIVTHNTLHLSSLATAYCLEGLNVAYFALEELVPRMVHRFYKGVVDAYIQKNDTEVFDDAKTKLLADLRNAPDIFENGLYKTILTELRDKHGVNFGALYLIKYLPYEMSLAELDMSMQDLQVNQGVDIGVMIVDYPDLMDYDRSMGESEAGGRLYASIRGVGQKYDTITWVASQLNRMTYGADLKTEAHIEGSYRKQNALECLVVINQNSEEYENGFTRIYVGKARNSTNKGKILQMTVNRRLGVLRNQTPFEANRHASMLDSNSDSGAKDDSGHRGTNMLTKLNSSISGALDQQSKGAN